ncbi:MAG: HDOD domain-containing protein [Sedimentisphaerales bacterium]|nr:HDOD domain-containing protein [Sedimentisphaerales bacterium]
MAEAVTQEFVNQTTEIATLPEITLKIMEVVQDPRSTAHDLHKIVSNDPALSARILRVVNSAFYGLPGQIGSIDRAIMLLGLNAVKNIAIAASLSKMFKNSVVCDDFSGKDLWTHSVAVGASNKLLTAAMGLALPDEAFLAGLIHDLGLVAIMQCAPEKLPQIVELTRTGISFIKAEQQILGSDHQEIGAALAKRWKFPKSFQLVTMNHHHPEELERKSRLLAVVTHISDISCAQRGLGVTVTAETQEVDNTFLKEIEIPAAKLEEILSGLEDELEVVRSMIE